MIHSPGSTGRKFPPVLARHPVWYCLVAVSIPLVAMLGAALAMRSDWFVSRSGNAYIATIGYGAGLHHVSCDVLIDGDSTAMVGVIPEVITRQTGLSSCNIAEFAGMEQVNGRLILDQFLKNNPRPKYIVFVYVPESLSSHEQWTSVSHFEAIFYRWRTLPDRTFFLSFLSHPREFLSSWTLGLRLTALALLHAPMSRETLMVRNQNLGWLPVPGTILHSCQAVDPSATLHPTDSAYIHSLRNEYGTHGTWVLVDVTPEAACDSNYDYYTSQLQGIIDNRQQKFPINLYNNSGRLHLIPEGAERFSLQIASQILAGNAAGSLQDAPNTKP